MRIFLGIVLFVAAGTLLSPQAEKQNPPRYEPLAVLAAADVAYPLQSICQKFIEKSALPERNSRSCT